MTTGTIPRQPPPRGPPGSIPLGATAPRGPPPRGQTCVCMLCVPPAAVVCNRYRARAHTGKCLSLHFRTSAWNKCCSNGSDSRSKTASRYAHLSTLYVDSVWQGISSLFTQRQVEEMLRSESVIGQHVAKRQMLNVWVLAHDSASYCRSATQWIAKWHAAAATNVIATRYADAEHGHGRGYWCSRTKRSSHR